MAFILFFTFIAFQVFIRSYIWMHKCLYEQPKTLAQLETHYPILTP